VKRRVEGAGGREQEAGSRKQEAGSRKKTLLQIEK